MHVVGTPRARHARDTTISEICGGTSVQPSTPTLARESAVAPPALVKWPTKAYWPHCAGVVSRRAGLRRSAGSGR